jgi:LacI family transcriptional regulator
MSTLRDVAARATVSVTTVARVIRGDKYVKPEVQHRVRAAIDELGYVPNLVARSLRTGREDAIGIAVPEITDSFYAEIIQTVERCARARGMAIIVTSFGDDPASEQSAVEALLSRQIAGLISVPVANDQSYLRHWQDRAAMVFIDREPMGITADTVVEDDVGGARAAVSHLVAHGHRRIAFLGDPPTVPTAGRRLEGYATALREHGRPVDDALIRVGSDVSGDPAETLRDLLDADDAPTAVFSANSRCSVGIVPALQRMGRNDVGLVSYGDFPMAEALVPSVTVVDQNPAGLGQFAVARLYRRIDSPGLRLRRRTVLPVELLVRESCATGAPTPLAGHSGTSPDDLSSHAAYR